MKNMGDSAAAGSGRVNKQAGAGKAKAAGETRRTKLVKVDQQYIDDLLAARAVCPPSFPAMTYDSIPASFKPETRKRLASSFGKAAADLKLIWDAQDEVLKQYAAKGTAYVQVDY